MPQEVVHTGPAIVSLSDSLLIRLHECLCCDVGVWISEFRYPASGVDVLHGPRCTQAVQREPPLEPPLILPELPEEEPGLPGNIAPPELLPGVPPCSPDVPELLPPELPPEGGVAGLVSVSEGGGVDGADSGAVCGGGVVLVPPCSVPLPVPPPPPRLQPARLIKARLNKIKIFDAWDFGFIPVPFN